MAVRIVTDSASSLSDQELSEYSIAVIRPHVLIDGQEIPEQELHAPGFYPRIADMSEAPTTSQPAPAEFVDSLDAVLVGGDEILAVLVSAGMSGSFRAAELAAEMIVSQHPEAHIEVLDSRSNSLEEGFAVLSAARVARDGGTLGECRAAAEDTMRRTRFLFTPHTLDYLRRGGRISGASKLAGAILKIAPILTAKDGETGVAGVARGNRAARAKIAAIMAGDIERCGLRQVVVQYVDDEGEAKRFAEETVEPVVDRPVPLVPIHPVVGVHVGPAVGVVYETEEPLR